MLEQIKMGVRDNPNKMFNSLQGVRFLYLNTSNEINNANIDTLLVSVNTQREQFYDPIFDEGYGYEIDYDNNNNIAIYHENKVLEQSSKEGTKQTIENQYQYQTPKIISILAKKRKLEDKYSKYMASKRPKQIDDEEIEQPTLLNHTKIDKNNNTTGNKALNMEIKTTPNLATNLNRFDLELGSVEDSKTPSPKCVNFNTNVGVKLFEVEGAHD